MKTLLTTLLLLFSIGLFSQSHPDVIAAFPFYGNGNNADGDRYHATAVANPIPVPDRFGTPARAFYLDGSDDYFDVGYDLELGTGDFAIEIWCYNRSVNPPDGNAILNDGTSVHNTPRRAGYSLKVRNDDGVNKLVFSIGDGSGGVIALATDQVRLQQWNNAVVKRSGTNIQLWLNG